MNSQIIVFSGEELPQQLNEWKHRPDTLWFRGDTSLLRQPLVSVIGSRDVSTEGVTRTRRIVKVLVDSGACVVSGMAEGVDASAHLETLKLGGKTIAVLGTPIEGCYPVAHKELKEQIAEKGLIISQFAPESRVYRSNFPQRNKLMAALCVLTIVVEAGPKSGTRHQVKCALTLGRRVAFLASMTKKRVSWVEEAMATGKCMVISESSDLVRELETLVHSQPHNVRPASSQRKPAQVISPTAHATKTKKPAKVKKRLLGRIVEWVISLVPGCGGR